MRRDVKMNKKVFFAKEGVREREKKKLQLNSKNVKKKKEIIIVYGLISLCFVFGTIFNSNVNIFWERFFFMKLF